MEKYTNLSECLEWNSDNDFGIPTPTKLLHKLQIDYKAQICLFLETLSSASAEERKTFYEPIYETLYIMAAQNDADSIRHLFQLCPGLRCEGYYSYDQELPLGEAIRSNAYEALDAFLSNGCDINLATFAPESTISFAMSENESEHMLIYLLEHGALLEFQDILTVWVYENKCELAKKMLDAARFFETEDGVKGLLQSAEEFKEWGCSELDNVEKQRFEELVSCLKTLC